MMISGNTLRKTIHISLVIVLLPLLLFINSPAAVRYEVISADFWIERHNENRYLAYHVMGRTRFVGFFALFFWWHRGPRTQHWYLNFIYYDERIFYPQLLPNIQMFESYGDFRGFFWGMDDFLLDPAAYNRILNQDWAFPPTILPTGNAFYLEIVRAPDRRYGIPLVDGKYVVLIDRRDSDIIVIDVVGDNISTQIIKRK
jgi:hypothetical protein